MPDSALTAADHLHWWWALAAIAPAVTAVRASRRSGAQWSRPILILQIAISLAIAGLIAPLLAPRGIGAWAIALSIPGSIVAPACVLLVALGGSSRLRGGKRAGLALGCALPAVLVLAVAAAGSESARATAWAARWLSEGAGPGLWVGWFAKLPATFGIPCLLASLLVLLDEHARPPKSRLRQGLLAGLACAAPLLTTLVCALLARHYGFEPVNIAYLVPCAIFGWILYPGRIAHLDARMAAIDALGEAVVIVDATNKIVDANSRAIELLQPATGDLRGLPIERELASIPELLGLLADPSKICVEFFTGKSASTRRCHEARIHELEDGESSGSRVIAIRDITSNRAAEDKLFYQAHFDSLTGLPNRRFFLDKIAALTGRAKQSDQQVALMYLDFDHFKEINDSLGHSAGDELLRIMAHRLRQHLRNSDTLSRTHSNAALPEVSRLGGDEFAILMSEFSSLEDVKEVAKRILTLVADPVTIGGQCVWNACSIGIAIFPKDGEDISTLVKNADSALYYAKSRSRGNYEFYRPEFASKVIRKTSLEKQLRGAIEAKELVLHYQPKIDLQRAEVGGAEALLRWENSELGIVPPKEFIPVAEECGLIASIGAWVIESACSQIRAWRMAGLKPVPISVNVSCFQFTRMDLQQSVTNALSRYDILPNMLELELTESALLQDNDQTASCLRELRAIGVKISLDDFGTGYSALSYLNRVPLDVLKMDRAFIRDVHTDPSALGVTSAVVSMAHSLGLSVVAEGVDCAEQIEPLRKMGCDMIQGFIFSAALDAKSFAKFLTTEGRHVKLPKGEVLGAAPPTSQAAQAEAASRSTGRAPSASADEQQQAAARKASGDSEERYALVVDDERMQIGRTAMRMNQMGVPSYYARDPDEGVLFAVQEGSRISALLISSETKTQDVERIAERITRESNGGRPSIVVVGDDFDATIVDTLRQKGPVWSLRMPFDDAELRFVVNAALDSNLGSEFIERNRVPIHLLAWTRVGDVTGHGVISTLSPRGAFIEMDEPLSVGTALQLEFSLSEWPVSMRARVVYIAGDAASRAGQPMGVGVVFLERDRETSDRILEEVEKRAARYIP